MSEEEEEEYILLILTLSRKWVPLKCPNNVIGNFAKLRTLYYQN